MKKREKKSKEKESNTKSKEQEKTYTTEELLELGKKNNRIDLAKPLFDKKMNSDGQE